MDRQEFADRYRVEARIGQGGMAEVYRGFDPALDRVVAIKVLLPPYDRDAGFVARFRREAQAAARLSHPNIVGVYDTGADGDTQYIVMEYIEGRTLASFLAGGGTPTPMQSVELTDKIAGALAAAHAQGIVHRDIKPANVMVTRAGAVKVMDFGIARLQSDATAPQTSSVIGTPAYFSPEQAQGQQVDARSDIYSLGCVLYELLAHRPPFTGDTPVAIAYKQVNESPVPPSQVNPDVPPRLDAVVMKCMAKNPANRYQSAAELSEDLDRVRKGQEVEATPLLPVGVEGAATQVIARQPTQVMPPPEPEGSSKNVWLGVLIGILVVAILAGGGYLLAKVLNSPETPTTGTMLLVKGLPYTTAKSQLEGLDLGLNIVRVPEESELPPDQVIAQDPKEGDTLNVGDTVTLTVAVAPKTVTVPDLSCKTLADAATLLGTDLVLGTKTPVTSDACPPDTIVDQDPKPLKDVPIGTFVNVTVASGPATITLEDYSCLNYNKVKNELTKLGLVVNFGGAVASLPQCQNPAFVAQQEPAPGTPVQTGGERHALHRIRRDPEPQRLAMTDTYVSEDFTPEERALLEPRFSNLEGPVFALTNLPEAVKGAMFARYSRTTKSLRRLFLDEFADDVAGVDIGSVTAASKRAAGIYERVFVEYGDDSVAQLGGVHLACEQSSQLLAKALEWGRLAAYLEQSTRYMRYDDRPGGRWRATVPPELAGTDLEHTYETFLDDVFSTYGRMYEQLNPWFRAKFPKQPNDTDFVYNQTILAKTCDTLRMVLPAGTRSNLGIYATGQSYEQLLMRLAQHPLAEMRAYGDLMLLELRKVIPEFLKRIDQPDRGVAWSAYWRDVRERTQELTTKLVGDVEAEPRGLVNLVDHDPEGELKVIAAVLYAHSDLPDDQLLRIAASMSAEERAEILAASVGERGNRRHKPGRAWERTQYRFDVLCDYGAYRDLQRHRPLTIEWQRLTPSFGYDVPAEIDEAGLREDWEFAMRRSRETHDAIAAAGLPDVAQYSVSMAYRIRFVMQMTAREAMHLTELRSQPAGHPAYRAVAQEMHRAIAEVHPAIAAAFTHISYEDVDLERLEAERRTERKRRTAPQG